MSLPSAGMSSSLPRPAERQQTSPPRRNPLHPGWRGAKIKKSFSRNFLEGILVSLQSTRPPEKSRSFIKGANPSPRDFGDQIFRSLPTVKPPPSKSALLTRHRKFGQAESAAGPS